MGDTLQQILPMITLKPEKSVHPPIRYTGSKFRAAKHIIPHLERIEYDEYREPFLGCGAIFFTMPLVKYNWLNDIDEELIKTFQVMANNEDRNWLIQKIQGIKPNRELFYKFRYEKAKEKRAVAYRYFVINRTAYGGIMNKPNWGFHEIKSVQPDKWPQLIENAGLKLGQATKITSVDYKEVITAPSLGKEVILFLDPPYFKADQKRAYTFSFNENDHYELLNLLKKTPYKFCLTYDNCEEIKDMYSWANINEVEWRYHTSNSNKAARRMGKELIITNY